MQIHLASIGKNKINGHVDKHYCLASIKSIKLFASTFSQNVILISQNDKAKVFICNFFLFNISFKF